MPLDRLSGINLKIRCEIMGQTIVNDDPKRIADAIYEYINRGAQMVVCTGA